MSKTDLITNTSSRREHAGAEGPASPEEPAAAKPGAAAGAGHAARARPRGCPALQAGPQENIGFSVQDVGYFIIDIIGHTCFVH